MSFKEVLVVSFVANSAASLSMEVRPLFAALNTPTQNFRLWAARSKRANAPSAACTSHASIFPSAFAILARTPNSRRRNMSSRCFSRFLIASSTTAHPFPAEANQSSASRAVSSIV